jgi:hypothetical protein
MASGWKRRLPRDSKFCRVSSAAYSAKTVPPEGATCPRCLPIVCWYYSAKACQVPSAKVLGEGRLTRGRHMSASAENPLDDTRQTPFGKGATWPAVTLPGCATWHPLPSVSGWLSANTPYSYRSLPRGTFAECPTRRTRLCLVLPSVKFLSAVFLN